MKPLELGRESPAPQGFEDSAETTRWSPVNARLQHLFMPHLPFEIHLPFLDMQKQLGVTPELMHHCFLKTAKDSSKLSRPGALSNLRLSPHGRQCMVRTKKN